jgi:hypothetical protein
MGSISRRFLQAACTRTRFAGSDRRDGKHVDPGVPSQGPVFGLPFPRRLKLEFHRTFSPTVSDEAMVKGLGMEQNHRRMAVATHPSKR